MLKLPVYICLGSPFLRSGFWFIGLAAGEYRLKKALFVVVRCSLVQYGLVGCHSKGWLGALDSVLTCQRWPLQDTPLALCPGVVIGPIRPVLKGGPVTNLGVWEGFPGNFPSFCCLTVHV